MYSKNILLIDDDIEDHEIFMDALKEIGPELTCFCTTDGEGVLKLLSEKTIAKPDILFIDLNMPKINGKQLLQKLKIITHLQDIPVVMYSTFFGESDIEEITRSGAAYYIIKPTRFADLCAALKNVIAKI